MPERRFEGFFYGLFMDSDLLRQSGVFPADPRHAFVDGFALRIGRRATLVSSPGDRVYGMVYSLTRDELETLYGAPGLEDYHPEALLARTLNGQDIPALCYNLPEAPGPEEANAEYASKLRAALGKLGFPDEYIKSVR